MTNLVVVSELAADVVELTLLLATARCVWLNFDSKHPRARLFEGRFCAPTKADSPEAELARMLAGRSPLAAP